MKFMHIINYQKLESMFSGKSDKVEVLLIALKKRIPEWQSEVQEALASKDLIAMRKVCHRIRGAAGTITAEKLEQAAIEWGDIIKENRTDEIPSGYANLINALKDLEAYTLER